MTLPRLGVVIVTYNAANVILDCLESLFAARGTWLDIVVVDNESTDGTVETLRAWASGAQPYVVPRDMPFPLAPVAKPVQLNEGTQRVAGHRLTLIETDVNGGFAFGVNTGLAELAAREGIDRFWILNPDSAVPPETPHAFASFDTGPFSLLGGRVLYYDKPDMIQIDGGRINRRTGVTDNIALFQAHADTPPPDPAGIDFIMGASIVASRAFYDAAGPMPEDYFLYYEEVDWALRRGTLPLAYCPDGIIYHRAGTAIGSANLNRPAGPFSLYFKHRSRMRFMRRHFPVGLPTAFAYSLAKAAQLALKGYRREAWTLLLASLNRPPPAHVRGMLSESAARRALPEHSRRN
ncbi:glycosyltransferase family 2 protein [Puniceibacterium sp. IMCC21224]|uniref:glycosyltransferase family 2 protein n=1 Tax=Puniceibacterium sp. IMCC21224 TaxID=1618204 RepID=UPI00064D7FF0|nr:glycosyltransferase family 2 protein [Puniceibacterium sp. IMCC21224]KMK63849.1 putative glycosyltransferase [Puniceibacterium sp. IMCC21224]